MTYGGGAYGEAPYGSVPEPEEFNEQSEQEKNEDYREIYNKLEELDKEIKEHKSNAEKWRRDSWIWRAGSFVTGNITGLIISAFI
jgi:hypothetical protein